MANNKDYGGNKTKTTKFYQDIYNRIQSAIEYAKADQAYARVLLNSNDKRTEREGQTLLKSAFARLGEQRKALGIFKSDCNRALARGEISKFWE